MSTQVERLQALLERVENNRARPRGAQPRDVAGMSAPTMPELSPLPAPLPAPTREPAPSKVVAPAPASVPQPAPAPMRAPAAAAQRPVVAQEVVAPPRAARAEPQPAKAAPAAQGGPSLVIDPQLEPPSKPIAQVVSKHPPSTSASFGDLLRRSLSARPR